AANTSLGQMLWGEQPGGPAGADAPWRAHRKRPALESPLAGLMPNAEIVLMPAAHADLGSDIVSAALAAGLGQKIDDQQITLLIDLGLSTEIVAAGQGHLLAVSVSTPALEGVSVSCGMRATVGAIVRVELRDRVRLVTVRDARPRGVSGAGLLSAVYALLSAGLLSAGGSLVFDRDLPPRLLAHFARGLEGGEFLLSHGEGGTDIVVEQNDIRQLQLAKGNVYAACQAVLAELCVTERHIGQILIGESFGAHTDPPAALALGLIPRVEPEKVKVLGNAAWQGAFLCLGDKARLTEAQWLASRMERLDLSANRVYAGAFLPAMEFTVPE
ncbi:MAG: ATP-binding protein, partial [Clostridiales bacterium]|nr:ATP-binding protein [Clostridiales bacterium]